MDNLLKKCNTGLIKAIKYYGSQKALGKNINVSQQQINYWLNNSKRIPYQYVLKIEAATNGYVSRYELAPEKNDINNTIEKIIEQNLQKFTTELITTNKFAAT